ncbi:hypothetical protein V1478_006455 [Vespula squamosa]|uniref:Uncharacterized protein n=1 Tax=Vespula squamosa TaxID=30214 RepID=A0ABD2B8E3_VESSQ
MFVSMKRPQIEERRLNFKFKVDVGLLTKTNIRPTLTVIESTLFSIPATIFILRMFVVAHQRRLKNFIAMK